MTRQVTYENCDGIININQVKGDYRSELQIEQIIIIFNLVISLFRISYMSFTIGQQSRPKLYLVPKPNFSLFDKKISKLILANFKSGII